MGEAIHTVCCVAEGEPRGDDNHCSECNNKLLERHEYFEETRAYFDADVFVADGNLQSYQFNFPEAKSQSPPPEYSEDLKVRIDYPPPEQHFSHLCVRYNREGGPRINVVAALDGGGKFRPSNIMAVGTDKVCPIKSARVNGNDFAVDQFKWDKDQITIVLSYQDAGAWTIGEEPFALGDMELTARPELWPDNAPLGKYKFVRWEKNRLSYWVEKQVKPQSIFYEDTITFNNETYIGLIAYYKFTPAGDGDPHAADTLPGPESLDEPARGRRWQPLSVLLQVWSGIVDFVKRLFS